MPASQDAWGLRPYLPVLQVLHGHEQAAGDVEELPTQTVWGANTGRSRSGRQQGAQADVPSGSPSPARLLPQILGQWHLGALVVTQDHVGHVPPALPSGPLGPCPHSLVGDGGREECTQGGAGP